MPPGQLIRALEEVSESAVVVIAASWRADLATDLDAQAARAFSAVLDDASVDHLTLVCSLRGGEVAFADAVARSLRTRGITYDLAVPTLINGVGGLLALQARNVRIHPHGAVGAYDSGPLRIRQASMSPTLFDDVPALGGIRYEHDPSLPTRLAAGMQERRLARELAMRLAGEGVEFDALSHLRLGAELGLDPAQLCAAGFTAETWDEPTLWELFCALEDDLGLLARPTPAYTEADLGDEVEFEPAVGLLTAVIASSSRAMRYEVDTGSPDPDTGVYAGAWSW